MKDLSKNRDAAAHDATLGQALAHIERAANTFVPSGVLSHEQLRGLRERVEAIVLDMPVLLDAFDPAGLIIFWNHECERVTGYTASEIVGNPRALELLYPDAGYRTAMQDEWRRRGNNYRNWEWDIVCKDGTVRTIAWSNVSSEVIIPGWATWGIGVDVTERKVAERNLRISEERLRLVTDHLPVLISYVDRDRYYRFNNAAYREWFGLEPGSIAGRHVRELLGEATYQQRVPFIEAALRGETVRFEGPTRHQTLGLRDTDLTYVPDLGNDGSVRGFYVLVQDVSDRKAAEAALRQSEVQFRQLADALPQIVWTARPDGFIDYYNQRWYEFTGFPRGAYGDSSWKPILHPDDVDRCVDTYYACVRTGAVYQIEYRFKDRFTGGYRWFLGRAYPVCDERGRIVRWFGTCTDIDDTKRAVEALHKQNQRLRLLSETAALLLSAEEPDRMVRGLFERVRSHLGVDAYFNFLINEFNDGLKLLSCAGIPAETANAMSRLDLGQAVCGTVAQERRAIIATHVQQSDDPKLDLIRPLGIRAYACNPLMAGSRLLGTLSFASRTRDSFDDDELDFIRTLCHNVAAAYERLRLIEQLRAEDRRKDEFLATLAHELRNPLAPIRNSLNILRLEQANEPQGRTVEIMERQVAHMVRLVDDLLEVSRITRGKIELRKEPVELAAVIRSAVETSRPLIDGGAHELAVALPTEPIMLEADAVRLAQVIANLLNNAAKYTNEGGQIWVGARLEGQEAVISIRDSGVGIPPEMLPRVFDMFAQVDRTLKRAQGGLGIGLTLARTLVEMHGGRIEAHSDGLGKGSEFTLRLPVAATQAGREAAADDADMQRLGNHRILVVDDHRDAAESLGTLLTLLGHEVHVVYDGPSALQAVAQFGPTVVLLDIGMPIMDGYEVAQKLRSSPGGADLVLVALTGWGQQEDRRRSQEAGFDRHLVKPADVDVIRTLLASLKITSHDTAVS